jgi:hypothetical protein
MYAFLFMFLMDRCIGILYNVVALYVGGRDIRQNYNNHPLQTCINDGMEIGEHHFRLPICLPRHSPFPRMGYRTGRRILGIPFLRVQRSHFAMGFCQKTVHATYFVPSSALQQQSKWTAVNSRARLSMESLQALLTSR